MFQDYEDISREVSLDSHQRFRSLHVQSADFGYQSHHIHGDEVGTGTQAASGVHSRARHEVPVEGQGLLLAALSGQARRPGLRDDRRRLREMFRPAGAALLQGAVSPRASGFCQTGHGWLQEDSLRAPRGIVLHPGRCGVQPGGTRQRLFPNGKQGGRVSLALHQHQRTRMVVGGRRNARAGLGSSQAPTRRQENPTQGRPHPGHRERRHSSRASVKLGKDQDKPKRPACVTTCRPLILQKI